MGAGAQGRRAASVSRQPGRPVAPASRLLPRLRVAATTRRTGADGHPRTGSHDGVPRQAGASRASAAASRTQLDVKGSPYLYIAPFFLLFGVFGLFPLVYTAWVACTTGTLLRATSTFVGAGQLQRAARRRLLLERHVNTFGIFVLSTVPQLLLALWSWRTCSTGRCGPGPSSGWACCCPTSPRVAAVAIIFGQLFGRDFGLINWVLGLVGVERVDWQAGTCQLLDVAIATMVVWRWTGYNALISWPPCRPSRRTSTRRPRIDGAGQWRQFWRITMPMLRPTIIFVVIVSTIGGLQLFTEPLLFGGHGNITGGADRQFQTAAMFIYEQGFSLARLRLRRGGRLGAVRLIVLVVAASTTCSSAVGRRED